MFNFLVARKKMKQLKFYLVFINIVFLLGVALFPTIYSVFPYPIFFVIPISVLIYMSLMHYGIKKSP